MRGPYGRVTPHSFAILETTVPLAAGANISQSIEIDTVSGYPVNLSNVGFGGTGAIVNDYTPANPDPRFFVDYYIFAASTNANALVAHWCPGVLTVSGKVFDTTGGALSAASSAEGVVVYTGICESENPANVGIHGTMRISGRTLNVVYVNGSQAQSGFRLGVYLRSM